ncbi:MAG: ATPase [Cereibacter sphaeroides]|uniref:ATPase n=1 Tax=Cereibacter sphaeroides TaxID=1063 RepID=A0A2W5S3F1_CERSP|nr:MAG: ATPase [Cereibacter sphaeroides]
MSGWTAKRFWAAAHIDPLGEGFGIRLDNRVVKTPAKSPLVVPTLAMAQAIAQEWDAQIGKVDPETMPVTRAANAAIDKVATQFDEVVELLAAYGDTDLLCYRATGPEELVARQAELWDPLLAWSADSLGAPLIATAGVMHIDQPPESLARLTATVAAMDNFRLTGFHDLVAISGSLVLALAVVGGRLDAAGAWALSRLDETWQAELWGRDEDAEAAEALRLASFVQAERFYRLCESREAPPRRADA